MAESYCALDLSDGAAAVQRYAFKAQFGAQRAGGIGTKLPQAFRIFDMRFCSSGM